NEKLKELSDDVCAVNAFNSKLGVWITHLKNAKLTHFPNLEKISHIIENKYVFLPENYCAHLDKVAKEFNWHFGELDVMGCIAEFVSNPFMPIDVEQVLKARSRDSDFWGLVNRQKFPLLTACALKVNAYFGSTNLCEMPFSQMKIVKLKYRTTSQTTENSRTVFNHSHHTDLSEYLLITL
uniref:HAT C-terminal dimerisation domain-containing protein n=1 Tax=Cyprinus carpio TaxID=7962 RepID=A0A8C1VAC0_CYPCA